MLSFKNVTEVKELISDQGIEFVCFYLSDIDGRLRKVTIPAETFSEDTLELGIGFDASNFGFAEVDRSDMILKPGHREAQRSHGEPQSVFFSLRPSVQPLRNPVSLF